MCSEWRALQLPFSILVTFCEQTSKNWQIYIICQGSDPHDTDLKSIVGFCEQTSKNWPTWIKKRECSESRDLQLQFSILVEFCEQTSKMTDVDHVSGFGPSWHRFEIDSRIVWTNFKKLTEVDQKMKVFRITRSTTYISILVGFREQISKMRVFRITSSTTFIFNLSMIL